MVDLQVVSNVPKGERRTTVDEYESPDNGRYDDTNLEKELSISYDIL